MLHITWAPRVERNSGTPGRALIDLISMQPGWTLEANGILHPRESEYEVQYVVNGFPVYDNRSPAFAASVGADDAESLKVYTGGIPAEFGQKLGGVVEINAQRNTSPDFTGRWSRRAEVCDYVGYASAQYVAGRTTGTVTAKDSHRSLPGPAHARQLSQPRFEQRLHRRAGTRLQRRRSTAPLHRAATDQVPGSRRSAAGGCGPAAGSRGRR
jgi:hypothetical protein